LAIVIAIQASLIIALIVGFLTYKLRFVIWTGYFRALVLCEDGELLTRTMRLKKSDTDFTMLVKGKLDTYHIIDQEPKDQVEAQKQGINAAMSRIMRVGRFRIPTSIYNAHQSEPINLQLLRKQSEVSATRYREIAKNTVTSQLLNAFQENPMKEAVMWMMAVGVVLVGMFILGYFLNNKIDQIAGTL
jgi:ABC-type antimicrobial peptide transport system permease subunit